MESSFTIHKPPFQQPPSTSPPPPPPNHRHVTVFITQSMKSSLPQRFTKSIQFPLRTLNIRSNHNNLNHSIMNDSGADKKKDAKSSDAVKEPVKLPEPPEKPLAGDCCGSGCVRCVWDVYYDELEEYNKIVKDVTDSATSKAS